MMYKETKNVGDQNILNISIPNFGLLKLWSCLSDLKSLNMKNNTSKGHLSKVFFKTQ